MRHCFLCLLALGALSAVRAEEPLALREARRALSEALPEVALVKLRPLLKPAPPGLSPEDQRAATLLHGEALALTGKTEQALTVIKPLAAAGHGPAIFLQAGILAGQGRWEEARP